MPLDSYHGGKHKMWLKYFILIIVLLSLKHKEKMNDKDETLITKTLAVHTNQNKALHICFCI